VTPQPRHLTVPSPASVWEKVAGYLGGFSPKTLGLAAAAAALLLVAQAATIGVLVTRDTGVGYETASDPATGPRDGMQILVTLQPGVTAATLTAALVELKGSIVEGPKAGGYYRLKLTGDKADSAAAMAKFKAKADVFAIAVPASR
jgi:hypothetical protein